MKKVKILSIYVVFGVAFLCFCAPPLWGLEIQHVMKVLGHDELDKHKKFFDDPRHLYKDWSWEKVMPSEDYAKIVVNPQAARVLTAEVLGFKAPDVVGKIAPEIKPGKYSYKDKDKYPGLKALMIPELYKRFAPGAPPLAGNFPEIEIVPTRQYYMNTKVAQATKENAGSTKLDGQGYVVPDTYISGYPFPRPSGQFAAQQYMYNWDKKNFLTADDAHGINQGKGFSRNLKPDYEQRARQYTLRLAGRALVPPYGFFDERAKARGEQSALRIYYDAPRDKFGDGVVGLYYSDANKYDLLYAYVGSLRRIRKMSNTDTQDATGGGDNCYEDGNGFAQKMSPTRYPYKYEIIEDREYLWPYTVDGSPYYASKGAEWSNLRFERRPVVVLRLTQLDKNFIYSKRIIYIDKETLLILHTENFDQKGRLYRTWDTLWYFDTATGLCTIFNATMQDHVDMHSTLSRGYFVPAFWKTRDQFEVTAVTSTGR